MPRVSLVVCLDYGAQLLDRLLKSATGCYDELLVIQDGSEDAAVGEVANQHGARFRQEPRQFNQEWHWPAAWAEAAFSWILRLDSDEVLGPELQSWLRAFRTTSEPDDSIAGYSCIWPLWNGRRIVTKRWPAGRLVLFEKSRVRFFGMPEQTPIPDGRVEPLPLVLEHRPPRKSYGLHNLLLRKQAYRWRSQIAKSLLGSPSQLPCWRWDSPEWPPVWQEIREKPVTTALKRLIGWPIRTARQMRRSEGRVVVSAVVTSGINHCLIALAYWRLKGKAAET